jgi:toxin-antitoxin system PIN domain toxin
MTALADVNVLVALVWEAHIHHAATRRWYAALGEETWATTPVTQTGFVRVSSNPAAVGEALAVREAVAVLAALIKTPSHRFLPDDAGFVDNALVPHERLVGHRQVTDAHLLGIARRHGARVVTFDRAMTGLGSDDVHVIAV